MTTFLLGLSVLRKHIRLSMLMALAVAIPVMIFLGMQAYQTGLHVLYETTQSDFLVVQVSGSMGEFYGSRLPASLAADLRNMGASEAIPSIHTITGTTQQDAILLRGVPLDDYQRLETFTMLAGRPLQPGDPQRLAMLGMRLADESSLLPGDTISIRGRDFTIIGVFESPTYAGNEAWVSLQAAQNLLGWGDDVSVFRIPAGETLQAGNNLPGGISIVHQGDSGDALLAEWAPFFDLFRLIIQALGLSAALGLTSILWRLAWLQRRELAILRSLGFSQTNLVVYLLAQASGISALGMLMGLAGAVALSLLTRLETAAIFVRPILEMQTILAGLAFVTTITLAGAILPITWLSRLNLAEILRAE
jgi:putative ABC transport system permease protein